VTALLVALMVATSSAAAPAERPRQRVDLYGHTALGLPRRPHLKQLAFHQSGARFCAVTAGRRGGKTFSTGREFMARVLRDLHRAQRAGARWDPQKGVPWDQKKPLLAYWCVAPTYKHTSYQAAEISDVLRRVPHLRIRWTKNRLWLRGGILIEFGSAERPDSLVGAGLDGMWVDEAALIAAEVWTAKLSPTLTDKQGWALFSTTPRGKNWYYREIVALALAGEPGYAHFSWATADNTAVPGLVDEVERARRTLPAWLFAQEFEASFDAFPGQIYAEFDRAIHVVPARSLPPPQAFDRVVAGVDWGWHPNPGVILVVGITGPGVHWVLHEEVKTMLPDIMPGQQDCWTLRAKQLRRRFRVSQFYADPSEPDRIDTWQREGVPVVGANNAVLPGISAVWSVLHPDPDHKDGQGRGGRPWLQVAEGCKTTIEEFGQYRWEEDPRTGETVQKPVKRDDHCMDALRYAIFSAGRYRAPEVGGQRLF